MNPQLTQYIIACIEQGLTNDEIISILLERGHSEESITEAFAEAYQALGLQATPDESLGGLVRPGVPPPPYAAGGAEQMRQIDTKLVGFSIMGLGVIVMMFVIYFALSGLPSLSTNSISDTGMQRIELPEPNRTPPSQPAEENETEPNSIEVDLVENNPSSLPDDRYRALDFETDTIEFAEENWLEGSSLCLDDLLVVEWFASLSISDVVLGVYQPSFDEPDIRVVGAFSATYGEEWVPGQGVFYWSVGALRDGERLSPGTGYRFILRDTYGRAVVESGSFNIVQCTQ